MGFLLVFLARSEYPSTFAHQPLRAGTQTKDVMSSFLRRKVTNREAVVLGDPIRFTDGRIRSINKATPGRHDDL